MPRHRKTRGEPAELDELWRPDECDEGRGLRRSLAAAVALHVLFFSLTFPELYPVELEPEDDGVVFVVQSPRFKEPPPPPVEPPEPPKPQVPEIPAPDLTPHDPEPVVTEMPEVELDLPLADELVVLIPEAPPDPGSLEPVRVGGRVAPPQRIHYVAPRYTERARRVHVQGIVRLDAVIDEEGRVTELRVLKSLPFGLTEAAVAAVRQWRFEPSTLDGKPVPVFYELTVVFQLR